MSSNEDLKTIKGATRTTEGLIPHLDVGGVPHPVKLDVTSWGAWMGPMPPLRRGGSLVYATPGGGELVAG